MTFITALADNKQIEKKYHEITISSSTTMTKMTRKLKRGMEKVNGQLRETRLKAMPKTKAPHILSFLMNRYAQRSHVVVWSNV